MTDEQLTGDPDQDDTVQTLLSRPCVLYRIYTANDRLLYVGISTGPAARIKQHETEKPWWTEATRIELEHFDTPEEAVQAERQAIQTETPEHNIAGGTRIDGDEQARRREERARRKAEDDAEREHLAATTYCPRDMRCTNCGQGWRTRIPRGTLMVDAECESCGCKALTVKPPPTTEL